VIIEQYYLTEAEALTDLIDSTDLSEDEVEEIVGRFNKHHWRFPGMLRGEVLKYANGNIRIRHHFTKKVLWKG
jgi:hypothetical protein